MSALQIIAEAGVNHDGELDRAMALVDAAAEAGADIVKFQAFRSRDLVAAGTPTAAYQKENTGDTEQRALLERLELSLDQLARIAEHCRAKNIEFLCTAFDITMIEALSNMGMRRIKIASGELNNLPALTRLASAGLPLLLSTGMATLDEVCLAFETLRNNGATDITLLHCTSLYPAPMESVNLRAMITMRDEFGVPVGYSDHTLGDHVAVAAVALGATVIEKHLTLDHSRPGPDHAASMEPGELGLMIARLREVWRALGDGIKQPSAEEIETARLVRRSWHAARNLESGHVIEAADVILRRPASGTPPHLPPIGRQLRCALRRERPVRECDLEPQAQADAGMAKQ